jgi:hypothetical protein
VVVRCCQREQGCADRDREHRERVAPAHVFAEVPDGQGEQEHEARAQQRLDERKRCVRERERLQGPAGEAERRADDPAWSLDQSDEQGESQRMRLRRNTRFRRLQRDADCIERRRGEGRDSSD